MSKNKGIKFPIRWNWEFIDSEKEIKVLFSAPKKNFKSAVKRNKIKRLMREAYRTQKHALAKQCLLRNVKIGLCLVYVGNEIPTFEYISTKMTVLLQEIEGQLADKQPSNETN